MKVHIPTQRSLCTSFLNIDGLYTLKNEYKIKVCYWRNNVLLGANMEAP